MMNKREFVELVALAESGDEIDAINRGDYTDVRYDVGAEQFRVRYDNQGRPEEVQRVGEMHTLYFE